MCRQETAGIFCAGDEPKSELARDLGDRLQSRNAPSGASGDLLSGEVLCYQRVGYII